MFNPSATVKRVMYSSAEVLKSIIKLAAPMEINGDRWFRFGLMECMLRALLCCALKFKGFTDGVGSIHEICCSIGTH